MKLHELLLPSSLFFTCHLGAVWFSSPISVAPQLVGKFYQERNMGCIPYTLYSSAWVNLESMASCENFWRCETRLRGKCTIILVYILLLRASNICILE
jgi:hypothetical protein